MKILFFKRSFIAAFTATVLAAAALAAGAAVSASKTLEINPAMPTVVIDAGHGGIDNGVRGVVSGADEADINLAIARNLKSQFSSAGFNCVMTRSTEAGLYDTTAKGFKARDMQKRREIIEKSDPDMVISIHQNFCPLPSKRGGTVFFNPENESGIELAKSIQGELNALSGGDRPNEILKGDYFMLKCTDSPSVIVECGFLSNETEDGLLNSEDYQRALAYAIFKGCVRFLSE